MATVHNEKSADGYTEQLSQVQIDHDDKREIDLDQARNLQANYVPDTPEEKALVRKLDWRLVVSCRAGDAKLHLMTWSSHAVGRYTFSAMSIDLISGKDSWHINKNQMLIIRYQKRQDWWYGRRLQSF